MRVSCFFVSAAVMLAQQASAAPIVGLPSVPIVAHEAPLVHSLSSTVETLPILGGLTADLLESESHGDLLSTTQLTGQRGLIAQDSRVGEIAHSLTRRQGLPLVGSLAPVTNGLTNPLLKSGGTVTPVTEGLTSQVTGLERAVPGLDKTTHGLIQSSPLNMNALTSILKRRGSSNPGSLTTSVPMISQVSSFPIGAIPGVGVAESIPGFGSMLTLGGAYPLPGLAKRDSDISVLGSVPVIQTSNRLTNLSGLTSAPVISGLSVGTLSVLGPVGNAQPIVNLHKREGATAATSGTGSIPGMSSLPSMPGMSALPTMGSLSSVPGLSSLPSMGTMPGMSSAPALGAALPGLSSFSSFL